MVLIEDLILVIVVFLIAFQILLPLIMNWPLFPLFRKGTKINNEIKKAIKENFETDKEVMLNDIKKSTKQKKGK